MKAVRVLNPGNSKFPIFAEKSSIYFWRILLRPKYPQCRNYPKTRQLSSIPTFRMTIEHVHLNEFFVFSEINTPPSTTFGVWQFPILTLSYELSVNTLPGENKMKRKRNWLGEAIDYIFIVLLLAVGINMWSVLRFKHPKVGVLVFVPAILLVIVGLVLRLINRRR